jgi:hypothetical protein
MTTLPSLNEVEKLADRHLVPLSEILEPSLDKFHHLPVDLLNLGWFLTRVR